eukprot:Hpha_TRINITY_DN16281_c4_g9::TRINITY_DN16281_c4_g9_i1::g.14889::m.14889
MFRAAARATVRAAARPAQLQVRTMIHQDNKEDDLTWLESDRKMTPEERYAFEKQHLLLKKQAGELREHAQELHSKQHDRIVALESQIAQLVKVVQDLKAQEK